QGLGTCELREPLAAGAIAHLVVVLQEVDERRRRQVRAALTPRTAEMARALALVREPFRERAAEEGMRALLIVLVVSVGLAGEQDVQAVMNVIVPLRIVSGGGARRAEPASLVAEVLEHEIHGPLASRAAAHRACDLG